MKIYLENNDEKYAVRDMVQLYLPHQKLEFSSTPVSFEDHLNVSVKKANGEYFYNTELFFDKNAYNYNITKKDYSKSHIKYCLYKVFEKAFGIKAPWGILTGIRPSKTVIQMAESGNSEDEITKILSSDYLVSDSKIKLVKMVAENEQRILKNLDKNKISLYVSIPFCPTRCLYCSFISQSIAFSARLVKPYLNALFKEIEETAKIISDYEIETVYIGGGTPTSLSAGDIRLLINKLKKEFNLKNVKEFTVEAGRPDTIDAEKLEALKECEVTRISINPQTMNDKTLKIIGRNHTSNDIREKFALARKMGFSHINMDLIAGLVGESTKDFKYSVNEIEKLNPESITVHSLCVKRGSYLDEKYGRNEITQNGFASEMIDYAADRITKSGKIPYYMYRQKNMAGNLENVGFCNKGCECLYNVYIMQEVQTIVSLGAGASTKLVGKDSIERVFNVKEVSEYINRIDEMIERKRKLLAKQ